MTLGRREFLHVSACAIAAAVARTAWALDYPMRPVRVVVGFTAGGGTDLLARLMGQWLTKRLGQPFVIENKPGAGGNLGTEAVVRAPPDGYTLLFANTNNAINATLFKKLNFNFMRDTAAVASIIRFPNVMVVHPAVPAKNVPEFIAYAKANPGKINMASAGNGGAPHVAGELFKMMTGVDMVHVPFRGAAQAMIALIAGQVQVMFATLPESIAHIRAGELRALAVTTATRSDALPELPTVADFVPGYEASAWQGLVAPKGTPPEIIAALNRAINTALADPQIQARFADLGGSPLPGSPAKFASLIAEETEKWAKVVKFSGAGAD
ncbi:MAG TPA: tripartite tricarboxylate transporter substrate binding protein [Xanthobacteraceae bacterium]|jgi:tripartite-type tricarboxylate transporter receptor subunit TctC